MNPYTVQVLKVGQADVPRPEVYWMSGWGEWETLYFYMVLIRGNGITAIINTGPPNDLTDLNERWREFAGPRCEIQREEAEATVEVLRRAGVAPDQVTHVLLTPLQIYATANIPLFTNAKICMSRRGWIEDIVARPSWLHVPRKYCISDEVLEYLLFQGNDRLVLLEDEDEICPGITAAWVGTHHRSSMLFTIHTDMGSVGVSDCAFKYGNLQGHPLGIGESLAEGALAYDRIRRKIQHFIPLYDPQVLEKYPDGIVA
ncbi:MAG: hypothetical protein ABI076_03240 [Acidobacteriaceae bacterium]